MRSGVGFSLTGAEPSGRYFHWGRIRRTLASASWAERDAAVAASAAISAAEAAAARAMKGSQGVERMRAYGCFSQSHFLVAQAHTGPIWRVHLV